MGSIRHIDNIRPQHHASAVRKHARPRVSVGLVFVAVAALAACGGGDEFASSDTSRAESAAPEAAAGMIETADSSEGEEASGDSTAAGLPLAPDAGDFDLGTIGRDVIIEMRVSMTSDDVQRTVAAITAHASGLGGGIASSEIDYGDKPSPEADADADAETETDAAPRRGFAVLVVKVPPSGVDQLLAGLENSGSVSSINQSAQDVTEQLVNLDVRIENARQSVENVRGFMEQATDLTDLVTLESELTRRQTELEVLEAQQRNISDRVALSTVTIEVRATTLASATAADQNQSISDAFSDGWSAFTGVLFSIGFLLAVLSPFLLVGVLLAGVAWLLIRNRRYSEPATSGAPTRSLIDAPPVGEQITPMGQPTGEQPESQDDLVTSTPPE